MQPGYSIDFKHEAASLVLDKKYSASESLRGNGGWHDRHETLLAAERGGADTLSKSIDL